MYRNIRLRSHNELLLKEVLFSRFRSITKQYFRKADGVVLLYDLSSESSFINIKSWMTSVEVGI